MSKFTPVDIDHIRSAGWTKFRAESDNIYEKVRKICDAKGALEDKLLKEQFITIIEEMVKSGDFVNLVAPDEQGRLTYVPWRELDMMRNENARLHDQLDKIRAALDIT